MKQTITVPFLLTGILFNVCLILSNLLEIKIIQIGSLTTTAGLMVFPIAYVINDCIVEVWGYTRARLIIWCGFAMNFLVIALTQLAVALPSPAFWDGAESFNFVFGMAPRIAAGSLCAFLIGSFLNAYVMSKMKIRASGRRFSVRAIASTAIGESADSLVFFPIAFGGVLPVDELLMLMATQAVLKSLYEVLILPVTVRVVRWLKRIEQTDVYDLNVSFNPFKLTENK